MSRQIRRMMELALEAEGVTAREDTMDAVDVQHTTTAYQRQHKSRFDRPVMIPIHRHREKARHRGRRVVRSRVL